MDLGIAGKTAAVAAASAGLGLASATALAAEGVRVVICGRDEERVRASAASIGAIPLVCDVSTYDGGVDFVRRATEAVGGPLDILIANSGGPPRGSFATMTQADYAGALQQNLLSIIGMCTEAVGPMRERGWGRIIAITSATVRQPSPGLILSTTARAGLTGFLKTLSQEVMNDGVTVNSILPGFHKTGRTVGVAQQIPSTAPGRIPGDPTDFGHIVAFLCSVHTRQVMGQALLVEGGQFLGLV